MAEKKNAKFLTYRGMPLVRCGNTLYYGNMGDPYVVMLQILSTKQVEDLNVTNRVFVLLLNNDPNINPKDKIVQKGEKYSLYQAIDLASVWLTRALEQSK
ncbi:MAG: hypothetical protein IJZ35_04335 [Clostridia bacterium]|nr:hypothetical protein [Clostridia bacterium]